MLILNVLMYTNATLLSLPPTPLFETRQETRSDLWPIKPTLLCNEARLDTWQHCTALQAAHARRRRCRCRRRNPARVAPAKKAETMRYDTTRHHSCIQAGSPTHSVPVHSAVMPTSASLRMNHHLTSGVLASKRDLTVLFASRPYMRGGIITLSPP